MSELVVQPGKVSDIKKIVMVLMSIVVLVGGVAAGVILVNREQDIREKAATQVCLDNNNCVLIEDPADSGTYEVNGIIYDVFLTDDQVRAFDPSVKEDGCYQVVIEADTVKWNKVGTEDQCAELINIQVWLTQLPQPSTPPVQSQCRDIKIYDLQWNLLTQDDLKELTAGITIRIAVNSNTSSGLIDQAKFTINGTENQAVSTKKPQTNEIYDEYVIPTGVATYTIQVQLHHSQFGWF
ncbi:MAG: hypothetical protein US60_C0024G0011 [Microgenomates group bacterium GW2011_GWC1_37_8]|nr:MAG: hypothetical protein US60_C0024G0011 [Microgenomates group bacterium GW2011_GWC1_37_8]